MLKLNNNLKNKEILKLSFFILILFLSMSMSFMYSISIDSKNSISLKSSPEEGYRQLQILQVFEDTDPGGWAGDASGYLETSSSASLPLDWEMTYNGKPSLRVNLQQSTEWWTALITPAGWVTINLEPYYERGTIEFNIRGASGGEQFIIGVRDKVYERGTESIDQTKTITDYITLTTEWQHVTIPLNNLINFDSGINLNQILCLVLGPAIYPPNPLKFWINDIDIISPDNELSFEPIKVNQVGYVPEGEKYALISGFEEELAADIGTIFEVRNAIDNRMSFTGTLTLVSEYDPEVSGEKVLRADFSALSDEGDYYISVQASGINNSPVFTISSDIYDDILIDSARYFYYQRANEELISTNALEYPHTAFHSNDFNCPLESGYQNIYKDVSNGWYDAGDFGKYTNAGATAIQDLLWAYQLFPSQFQDNQFNIPESGNNIPDLLDEIRHELEFILKCQDENSGGFYHRIQSIGDDTSDSTRAIKDIGDNGEINVRPTPSSADSVGILARAYKFYLEYDQSFANQMLNAAEFGWTYLENNPNYIGIPSGPYGDSDDGDDRLFAAACLYYATGDFVYNNYFLNNYEQFADTLDNPECAHFVGDNEIPALLIYLSSENPDSTFINWFTSKFINWRGTHIERANRVAWQNSLEAWQYWWGSNMMILNTPMDIAIGSILIDDYNVEVSEIVKSNLNYILGVNPMQICMVTGYGTQSTTAVFSNIYNLDNKPGLPKGILPGGANMYENRMTSRFNAKCYTNTNTDWTSSEHTIYWNSPLVFDLALVVAEAEDTQIPSINSPANVEYQEGETGNSLSWIATDDNPTTYTITRDGSQVASGSWSSGNSITINVDGLSIGTYTYICTVSDVDGQTNSDSVAVTVVSITEWQNGDVNHDGNVDIIDALLIAQYYVGLNPQSFYPEQADVNHDGAINIIDALLVAQAYVGLIELP
ncbi:MAG: glycoside hydrolase family 9 protein [Candidatus Lokiarchaeota archaeon]|nr:glycoside hydrolase family 9 protein [Candidatus Lokiarchaeota archaeon]